MQPLTSPRCSRGVMSLECGKFYSKKVQSVTVRIFLITREFQCRLLCLVNLTGLPLLEIRKFSCFAAFLVRNEEQFEDGNYIYCFHKDVTTEDEIVPEFVVFSPKILISAKSSVDSDMVQVYKLIIIE